MVCPELTHQSPANVAVVAAHDVKEKIRRLWEHLNIRSYVTDVLSKHSKLTIRQVQRMQYSIPINSPSHMRSQVRRSLPLQGKDGQDFRGSLVSHKLVDAVWSSSRGGITSRLQINLPISERLNSLSVSLQYSALL